MSERERERERERESTWACSKMNGVSDPSQ